ncbi:hypothetical protein K7432_008356 [Basidiobolus ranarum]|uniref:YbaK/aminoacyl-tRNA synthetase-associated domain-containing protein n=1 Tax=Basidiobolus ranarum TaxID=34480 RepID=A0ABR2WS05_9FUNG
MSINEDGSIHLTKKESEPHPPNRTCKNQIIMTSLHSAADQLNCPVAAIANSLIFEISETKLPLLILTSGGHKVDLKLVGDGLGIKKLKRATPDFVRQHTGFAIGGVAPIGHPEPIKTVVDVELSRFEKVWAAAGHPNTVFQITFEDLVRLSNGSISKVGEEIPETDPSMTK